MDQNFVQLEHFPRYSINAQGEVLDREKRKLIYPHPVTGGALAVRIRDENGVFHTRSVKVLVAEIFVDLDFDSEYIDVSTFDTPILLDNEPEHLMASNIRWRPRWFAWHYAHQFNPIREFAFRGPIQNVHNNLIFKSIFLAGMHYGLLFDRVLESCQQDGMPVWPTGHGFTFIY